jgi:hypothetical protein
MLSTETSWKFLTEACVTRPPKLRQYAAMPAFQRGGLLRSTTLEPRSYDLYLRGVVGKRGVGGAAFAMHTQAGRASGPAEGGLRRCQPSLRAPSPPRSPTHALAQQRVGLGARRVRPGPCAPRLQLGQQHRHLARPLGAQHVGLVQHRAQLAAWRAGLAACGAAGEQAAGGVRRGAQARRLPLPLAPAAASRLPTPTPFTLARARVERHKLGAQEVGAQLADVGCAVARHVVLVNLC